MVDAQYRGFVQRVIDNVKKNGFPEKKVAFPIEALYEAAQREELSMEKVLAYLDEIQIAHVKTPERIIFYPKDREPMRPETQAAETSSDSVDISFDLDPSLLGGMDPNDLMAAAAQMMQNLDPSQLEAVQEQFGNLTEEQRAALMEQAKKLGLL